MKSFIFNLLLLTRVIFPPIIFSLFHPFIAMLINECILDGLISPHHIFTDSIPESIKTKHKVSYDIYLDSWGFLNGLLPVLYKNNEFYNTFENYRMLVLTLFLWKIIGNIVLFYYRNYKTNYIFQNFYIAVYLAIGFCDYFKVDKKIYLLKIMILFITISVIREHFIISVNESM